MITATVPLPPSANNLFFNLKTGRRAKTSQYKAWQVKAGPIIFDAYVAAGSPNLDKKTRMVLTIVVGANYTRDISNCIKPIEDLVVSTLPVPDDRYNDQVSIKRDLTLEGMAIVTLAPLSGDYVGIIHTPSERHPSQANQQVVEKSWPSGAQTPPAKTSTLSRSATYEG